MATITFNYNSRNALAKSFIETAMLAGVFKIEKTTSKSLSPFEKSLNDIKHGRVTRVKNIDNVIEEILQ